MTTHNVAPAVKSIARIDKRPTANAGRSEDVQRKTALADYAALLAILFQYPMQPLIDGLVSGSLSSDFDAIARELELPCSKRQDALEQLSICQSSLVALQDPRRSARREYTRLFNHPERPVIDLYEGLFVDRVRVSEGKRSMDPRMFINPAALDAERCYRQLGFKRNPSINIPADCMTTELDYLSLAHRMHAKSILCSEADRVMEIGGAIDEFLRLHVEKWFVGFFERCIQESRISLYRTAGAMGRIYVDALLLA